MKKIYTCSAIALLIFSGCQMHETETSFQKEYTLSATLEGKADTKTHLSAPEDGIYYPYWSQSDKIAVFIDGHTYADEYTLKEGEGSIKGTFGGKQFGSSYFAYYPFSGAEGISGEYLTVTLPSEQVAPEGASFAEGAFPMVAFSETQDLQFKNLCSVLRLSLVGEGAVKSITFRANDESIPVSGKAKIKAGYVDLPQLVMEGGGSNEVTLKLDYLSSLDPDTPQEYFIVIPSGTYKGGFTVLIETFNGIVERSTTKDIVFERSQVRSIPTFECTGSGEIDPDDIPYNQIWYSTKNDQMIDISNAAFDRAVVSHTYENGKGIITFDGTLTSIGSENDYYARFTDYNLTEIHLPNTVEFIGFYCLGGIYESFHVPDNLKSVGEGALSSSKLTRIYGKKATADEKAIVLDGVLVTYANSAIGEILEIPEGTVSLANYLFSNIQPLKEVIFPEGFQHFGHDNFRQCPNLQYVTLPSTYNETSFYYTPSDFLVDCQSLLRFRGNSPCVSEDGVFLRIENGVKIFAGADLTDYTIPEGIERINFGSLKGRNNLKSLTFPSTLKSLQEDGWDGGYFMPDNMEYFYGTFSSEDHHSLVVRGDLMAVTTLGTENYTVPEEVTKISAGVLSYIKNLRTLKMGDNVKEIKYPGVAGQPYLEEIVFSAGLEQFELYDDPFEGDDALKSVYFRSYYPPSIRGISKIPGGAPAGVKMYVPESTLSLYQNSSTWEVYKDYFTPYHYDDLDPFDPGYYVSTDYSKDGQVTTLQKATEGNGINLILMGDAFSDRQIEDGTYLATMNKMMEAFFSEEPYTTYRNLFNVYAVNVVSMTEGYEHDGQSLSTFFGQGTHVGGDDSKCMDYALKVISSDQMSSSLIIVAMNSPTYAGTCYMYHNSTGDYGQGVSVAYFPLGQYEEVLAQLVHHEAGGHGFGKLADEYAYQDLGQMPEEEISNHKNWEPYGWWKNVDFTSDPSAVKWAKFLNDSRYASDNLGVFEGACTYWTGAYRPTENSIMRHNTGGFNAPSREAIWYRIHKLAYGDSWEYNYEDFVSYDQKTNIGKNASASTAGIGVKSALPHLHAPVIVKEPWETVYQRGKAEREKQSKR